MTNQLSNKIAIVTGSNKGIGKSVISIFAKNGAEVIACARKKNSEFENYCLDLSSKYNTKIHNVFFDQQPQMPL